MQNSDDDIEDLKKENEILKHELKIVELKLSLKKNGGKNDFEIKVENVESSIESMNKLLKA